MQTLDGWTLKSLGMFGNTASPRSRLGSSPQKELRCKLGPSSSVASSLGVQWRTSVKVQSSYAADWRPPMSGVGKMTGDLATRRGASDPARRRHGRARTTSKKAWRPGIQINNLNCFSRRKKESPLVLTNHRQQLGTINAGHWVRTWGPCWCPLLSSERHCGQLGVAAQLALKVLSWQIYSLSVQAYGSGGRNRISKNIHI